MDRSGTAGYGQDLDAVLNKAPTCLRQSLQAIAGSLQSLCWASSAVGGVVSAYFSGALIESYGTRGVFALTAVFPLIVSLSAALISEVPVQHRAPRPTDGMLGENFLVLAGWKTKHTQGQSATFTCKERARGSKLHSSA